MKKMRRAFLVCIAMVLMAVMSACSSAGADSSVGRKTALESIKEKGELTFAMTGQYPPFNFVNDEGQLTGFDVDIANAIAEKIGVKAKPVTTEWDGILTGLMGSNFDVIIGSMAVTPDREEQVNFSRPYYYDGAQFFVRGNSSIGDITELKDGKVGAVIGTTFAKEIEKMDNIELKEYQSDVDNMRDLAMERLDGLVTARFVGIYGSKEKNIDIKPAGEPLYKEKIAIPVRKEDEDLLKAINSALGEMIEDGTYAKISEKWFDIDMTDEVK